MDLLALFVDAIFVDNLALSFFLGICTFLAVSRTVATALGLGAAVILVQGITVPVNNLVHRHLLAEGAWSWAGLPEVDLTYLGLMLYIGVIAAVVQVLEMVLERYFPTLHRTMGLFLPLLAVNCAILGGSLFMVERDYGFAESMFYGVGSGVGWALAVVLLAGIREKLRYADVPEGLHGLGLSFIVVGLMSLGFLALADIRLG
ncbi:MAG: NADH:ubiquinone reductase (Na(+)-transporting) subunit E [Gammaproteobacteria bacterium]|nr:NADH:ubiquinone reductase (Na(+)-transporting) subunit E [Gammaproteobacteria bacterium]NIP89579.1 NADH:ubiquinone reductase (Na(+)-transporting) subunit E [Gammaproteobacteria bacterium]NIR24412.1 NADH:ubiquinone reductase (Na(+)-transporting) subunit E [Gammaproteobacteria bacterium]NIS06081.1 NADH:ubiquinone reductase (Na(+)-transporting) subunit E [Gammaproteobacteria bacterium]NIU41319.1 NADH:ubiquinone reductase (Na(+)-transporting) subunit E [Gammaproteobacteria bacterium]